MDGSELANGPQVRMLLKEHLGRDESLRLNGHSGRLELHLQGYGSIQSWSNRSYDGVGNRRYETAEAMAAKVDEYLAGRRAKHEARRAELEAQAERRKTEEAARAKTAAELGASIIRLKVGPVRIIFNPQADGMWSVDCFETTGRLTSEQLKRLIKSVESMNVDNLMMEAKS